MPEYYFITHREQIQAPYQGAYYLVNVPVMIGGAMFVGIAEMKRDGGIGPILGDVELVWSPEPDLDLDDLDRSIP